MKRIFSVVMALMLILSTTSQAYVVTINGQNCTYTMTSPANRKITLNDSKGDVKWWEVKDTSNNIIGVIDGRFVTPTSDVTVTPKLNGNQIVVQQTANGNITYGGNTVNTVQWYEDTSSISYEFTITPNSGYEIETIKVNNQEKEITNKNQMTYTFTNTDISTTSKNQVITATYVEATTTPTPEPEPTTYIVSFNANGGNGTMNSQTFTEGTAQNLSANTFTKTGYTFAGWNTKQDGTGDNYTNQASFTATENITLYAKWTPASGTAYTVYHYVENTDNTNYTLNNTENKTGTTGATITLANETTTIVGATYNKGSLTENGSETTTTTINSDGTTKIYLYYTRNQYQLTLNKNDNISSVSGAETYKYGQNVTIDATVKSETGYNYTFTNWTSNNTSLLSNQTTKNTTITMPNGNITLTANASKTPTTYTINYTLDGGTGSNPTSYTIESESFTLSKPIREGYTFTGWTGSNGTTAQTEVTITKGSTGNRSYTANWEEAFIEPNADTSGANAPVITTGLTPVNWNGSEWVETTQENWKYNYNSVATATQTRVEGNGDSAWANAQTADGSLYVWIPRYTYKITSGYHTSGNSWNADLDPGTSKIEIIFSNGTTDTVTSTTGLSKDGYVKHPAFTFGDDELNGIWVAKYEASMEDGSGAHVEISSTDIGNVVLSDNVKLVSKPGVSRWNYISLNNMFNNAYNLNRSLDSHLMKNVEWGAVAYLTNAIGRIPYINNNFSKTGYAGVSQNASSSDSTYAWNTENGVKASTTHNVYGIYDLSGGADEYVAAYVNNGNRRLTDFASSLVNSYTNYGSKYVDVYPFGTSDSADDNYAAWSGIKGDAVYETSSSGSSSASWDGYSSNAPYYDRPIFMRGGIYSGKTYSGIYAFSINSGSLEAQGNAWYTGFRPCLAIQ